MKQQSLLQQTLVMAPAILALLWSGCSTQQQRQSDTRYGWTQQQQRQAAAPTPAAPTTRPAPAAAPRTVANEGTLKTDLANLTKSAPASVSLGETFVYELR